MFFSSSTPSLKVYVDNSYLGLKENGFTEAYLIAITSIPSRPLFCTVHLVTGAVWSRLPLWALRCKKYIQNEIKLQASVLDEEEVQPFSCLEGSIQVLTYDHLKHYNVVIRTPEKREFKGTYLFTVDVQGPGLTEDPEQHKTHNIIALEETGEIVAYPNNMCLFLDEYFTENSLAEWPKYRRTDKFFTSN